MGDDVIDKVLHLVDFRFGLGKMCVSSNRCRRCSIPSVKVRRKLGFKHLAIPLIVSSYCLLASTNENRRVYCATRNPINVHLYGIIANQSPFLSLDS